MQSEYKNTQISKKIKQIALTSPDLNGENHGNEEHLPMSKLCDHVANRG